MAPGVKYEESARDVLETFAHYGFRKTSMEDIARSVGVSRHSIYKKFGSKEVCYEWAVNTYLADMYARIFDTLDNNNLLPLHRLTTVFEIFMGEAIDLVKHAHGTEILDATLEAAHTSREDWPLRFRTRLGQFLEQSRLAPAASAFVLISASKGLLLEEPSRAQFSEDMYRIINTIVSDHPPPYEPPSLAQTGG